MRWTLLITAACGGSSAPPAQHGPAVALASPAAAPDDVVIATVNGRPVWGSCVARQAAHSQVTREQARDQCIAFELLAQAAEARGLEANREVEDATKTALVSRLVETDFEAKYRTPADLAAQADAMLVGNEWRLHVPEIRASAYARFVVPPNAGFAIDGKAKGLADQLYAALETETGLFTGNLADAAHALPKDPLVEVQTADIPPKIPPQLAKPYADALFAIPDVGRVAPPVRTKWGWDVILLTNRIAARDRTREEFAADVFADLRRKEFVTWEESIARQLGIQPEKHDELLEEETP